MSRVEELEREIANLPPKDFAALREWFMEFDAELWDQQMEADVMAGKLDAMAQRALQAHRDGKSKRL